MKLNEPKIAFLVTLNVVLLLSVAFFLNQKNQPEINYSPPPLEFNQPPAQPAPPSNLDEKEASKTITEKDSKDILTWLAADEREGRMSGKKGNVAAANYIAEKFEKFGLEVSRQKFRIQRMNPGPHNEVGDDFTENIIGIIPGHSKRQIIIGAHMDHIGYGPGMSRSNARNQIHNGADDNASGSTVVLEITEAFSKMEKPNHTLVFICFSGEEMGLIGSRYYVHQLDRAARDNIDLMVNFDMVGWLKNQKAVTIYGIRNMKELVQIVDKVDDNYPFSASPAGASGGSDHAPFGNAGIPFAFFHTGGHPYYHTPQDDVERIDFEGLTQIAKFAFDMIYEFDKLKVVRTTTVKYPPLNETIHDHGHPEVKFPIKEGWQIND